MALWKGQSDALFTSNDLSDFTAALSRLSKTGTTSALRFANLTRSSVDEIKASWMYTTKSVKKAERQKELFSTAEKPSNSALNDFTCLCALVAVVGTSDVV